MSSQSLRAAPAGHVARPTVTMGDWSRALRWWRPETGIPRRCTSCQARLMIDPPSWERFGRVYCAAGCGREYAWISHVGWER